MGMLALIHFLTLLENDILLVIRLRFILLF